MKRTSIITGASRGIGRAIAEEFALRNYNLGLISRNYKDLESLAEEFEEKYNVVCLPLECDIKDKEQIKETFQRAKRKLTSIDVLVNNAGVNSRGNINTITPAGWYEEIETNLTGTLNCTLEVIKYMKERDKRLNQSIISISSIKGKEATTSPGYGASKAGIISLTKCFAKQLANHNIRVNCIAPGFIDTGLTTELPEDKKTAYKKMIPLERFGTPAEIAKVVAFLASEDASYITGATIDVNGGYLMS